MLQTKSFIVLKRGSAHAQVGDLKRSAKLWATYEKAGDAVTDGEGRLCVNIDADGLAWLAWRLENRGSPVGYDDLPEPTCTKFELYENKFFFERRYYYVKNSHFCKEENRVVHSLKRR